MDEVEASWFEEDFYAQLGVDPTADGAEVTRAYRRLARETHPDRGGDPERFRQVAAAYEVLGDPERRAAYDRVRAGGRPGRGAGRRRDGGWADGGWADGGWARGPWPGGTGPGFAGIEDLLAGLLGSQGGVRAASVVVHLGLAACLEPVVVDVAVPAGPCGYCGGAGATVVAGEVVSCGACGGSGQRAAVSQPVRLPAGVRDGQRLVVRTGAGELEVHVRVEADGRFERVGDDLRGQVEVPYSTAALGGTAEVPILEGGTVSVRVPAGTGAHTRLRVRGRGMPRSGGGRGDLYVEVVPTVCATPDDSQRRALEALRDAGL